MNWFQRIFTLPKNKNSVSDILGPDIDRALKATARGLIEEAADSAISSIVLVGHGAVGNLAAFVSGVIQKEMSGLSPELSAAIDQKVAEALRGVESIGAGEIVKTADKVVNALAGLLKL